jgi:hypothetical protein
MAAVMVPSILPTVVGNASAFIENVVRFPLGLAGISSPAASPLLGHLIVSRFPSIHRIFTVSVAGVGGLVLLYVLIRRTPRTTSQLSRLLAWVMTVAILLAPATRIGYLLYPVDFFVWAWLLRGEEETEPRPVVDALPGAGRRTRAPEPDVVPDTGDAAAAGLSPAVTCGAAVPVAPVNRRR